MNEKTQLKIGAPLVGEADPALQWIEVASSLQIPSFHVVGLPSQEVSEARERVRAAIDASGFAFPKRRVVMNLSPASIRKRGTGVDLAMALSVLSESVSERKRPRGTFVAWGELGLDGTLKPVGQLTRAIYAAWENKAERIILAQAEIDEARERLRWIRSSRIFESPPPRLLGAATLEEAWMLCREPTIEPDERMSIDSPSNVADDRRQHFASLLPLPMTVERVVGVAAAGSHHLLLLGPRGTGKSHALEWLVALFPAASSDLKVRHALLEELAGTRLKSEDGLPIRRVSSQVKPAALMGSANAMMIRPGEFSLAHGGVLLADEFPEWHRDSRELLREPLERGAITLTRAQRAIELPARFLFAANGNLCRCGGWPTDMGLPADTDRRKLQPCVCSPSERGAYFARLSGPILDRIDLIFRVVSLPHETDRATDIQEYGARLFERVVATRQELIRRWGSPSGLVGSSQLERFLSEHPAWQEHLRHDAFTSLRSRHRVLRVALTLAAWDGDPAPGPRHFLEAACYRADRLGVD